MRDLYPGYDVLSKRDTPSWNAKTREVIDHRLSIDPSSHRFFTDEEWEMLRAICDRIVPQSGRTEPIPAAAMVDLTLHEDRGDGYRDAEVGPMREAWRRGLAAIEQEAIAQARPAATRKVVIFCPCVMLFHFANAPLLPLPYIGARMSAGGGRRQIKIFKTTPYKVASATPSGASLRQAGRVGGRAEAMTRSRIAAPIVRCGNRHKPQCRSWVRPGRAQAERSASAFSGKHWTLGGTLLG
jgi:hypothetical protein